MVKETSLQATQRPEEELESLSVSLTIRSLSSKRHYLTPLTLRLKNVLAEKELENFPHKLGFTSSMQNGIFPPNVDIIENDIKQLWGADVNK